MVWFLLRPYAAALLVFGMMGVGDEMNRKEMQVGEGESGQHFLCGTGGVRKMESEREGERAEGFWGGAVLALCLLT